MHRHGWLYSLKQISVFESLSVVFLCMEFAVRYSWTHYFDLSREMEHNSKRWECKIANDWGTYPNEMDSSLTRKFKTNQIQISGVQLLLKGVVVKCLLHVDGIQRNEWRHLRLFSLISSSKFLTPQDFHISSCNIAHCKDSCNREIRNKFTI